MIKKKMNEALNKPKIILVLGMHRSGTSMVAQSVAEWGAFMGSDLMPPNEFNTKGYWEYNSLVNFHNEILEEFESKWFAPSGKIETGYLVEKYGQKARDLVAEMDFQGNTWCWKDPRTALFLNFWKEILRERDVTFIIVHRDVSRMAASLFTRDKLPTALAVGLWEYYTLRIFEEVSGFPNYYMVNYDLLVRDPKHEGENLFQFLDTALPQAIKPRKEILFHEIVDSSLDRATSFTEINLTPLQKELLDIYTRKMIPPGYTPSAEAISRLQNLFSLMRDPLVKVQSSFFAQLFYQNENQHFSEQNSFIRINPQGRERLTFNLRGLTYYHHFRFDPLNDCAHVVIHKVSFLTDNQQVVAQYTLNSNALRQEGTDFLFDTTDPQIFIKTETGDNFHPDTLIIEAEYKATGSAVIHLIKSVLNQHPNAEIQDYAAKIRELETVNSNQKKAMTKLQQSVHVMELEFETILQSYTELTDSLIELTKTNAYKVVIYFASLKRWILSITSARRMGTEIRTLKEIRQLKNNGLFDEDDYLRNNPDVTTSQMTAARHFVRYGMKEQRPGGFSGVPVNKSKETRSTGSGNSGFWNKALGRWRDKPEIRLIRESSYFNAEYYQRLNPDVSVSGMDPAAHFYHFGWKEGRNPGPDFDTVYYTETYEDVKTQGMNPLLHYLQYGAKEKRLPKPFEYDENDCIARADLTGSDNHETLKRPGKTAIICHLFHADLTDEFIRYFRQIPFPFDLLITTSEKNRLFLQETFKMSLPDVQTTILTFPNLGRDVAPFLLILGKHLNGYNLACKVHSKKSGHDKNLEGWRRYMLDQLLGNPAIIQEIVNAFVEDEKLGMVWPLPHPYLKYLEIDKGWGPAISRENNYKASVRFFRDPDMPGKDEPFEFPAGNMFWFRPAALDYLNQKAFLPEDFGEESGQIDGTLAHAIERMTGKIVEKSGFTCATAFFPTAVIENDRESIIEFPEASHTILFIAHDLFRAGAEMVLLHILGWLKRHTAWKLYVLALKKGNDGGKLLPACRRMAKVILLDEIVVKHPEENLLTVIRQEVGNPDLIYGNTILAATVYSWLSEFRVPVITHIHEMEESIRRYTTPEILENLSRITSAFIPCSTPVRTNLETNHGIHPGRLHQVEEFIRIDSQPLPDRALQRHKTELPSEKVIIWGCGTVYWRKGTDLFIETAGILKNMGVENFLFCWIGSNHWNNDRHEWGEWQKQEDRMDELSLQEHLVFLGEKEHPGEYFKAGDIYYLPSREDPYPLVCLEAAECELPVVCFEGAGGMPGFVEEDAGAVVPFIDTQRAAEAIAKLIRQPDLRIKQGKRAREKLLQRHTDDIAVPRILNLCRKVMQAPPAISVVVPVYNQAPFLRERLDSILKQRFRDVEIIILDDVSTDESAAIASEYLFHPAVKIIRNEKNSGSPFRQWQKGIEEAKGSLVWIAEGDDSADAEFLTTLIPSFNDGHVVMAYCGSHCVDEAGVISRQHYLRSGHYEGLGYPRERWLNDYVAAGHAEIVNALAIRNTIPNASAAIFRRNAFDQVDFSPTDQFKTAGDWFIYVSVLKHGSLAYHHQHLNFHRIRSGSVVGTHKMEAAKTIPDYFFMHRMVVETFDIPLPVRELMISSVAMNLRCLWPELSDVEFAILYDKTKIYQ